MNAQYTQAPLLGVTQEPLASTPTVDTGERWEMLAVVVSSFDVAGFSVSADRGGGFYGIPPPADVCIVGLPPQTALEIIQ